MTGKISTAGLWDLNGGAIVHREPTPVTATMPLAAWYAIQTHLRLEKKVAALLRVRGAEIFVPLLKQVHRWSDRNKNITAPLFPGYIFAHLRLSREQQLLILQTTGVLSFVGPHDRPATIPDNQIEALERLLQGNRPCSLRPFLHNGQRVRIRGGALDGVEGILHENSGKHLVIGIECIQRAVSVRIEGYDLEVA